MEFLTISSLLSLPVMSVDMSVRTRKGRISFTPQNENIVRIRDMIKAAWIGTNLKE